MAAQEERDGIHKHFGRDHPANGTPTRSDHYLLISRDDQACYPTLSYFRYLSICVCVCVCIYLRLSLSLRLSYR